jgi:hypothetical protein
MTPLSGWGPSLYGDPCRECGFVWSASLADSRAVIDGLPDSFRMLVAGASGNERHPDLGWSVSEYVCHVGDNLRIWAERLMGAVDGAADVVGGYNEHELADARNYETIPLAAALWSLGRAVGDWQEAVGRSRVVGTILVHPERGAQTLDDVARSNAHDALHHQWDIERTLLIS